MAGVVPDGTYFNEEVLWFAGPQLLGGSYQLHASKPFGPKSFTCSLSAFAMIRLSRNFALIS